MGRIKSYDEEVVLEKAMFTFWKHGYDQVSIRQLEQDMGINQFSIYSSFKSKENLFRLVLEKYKLYIETNYLTSMYSNDASLKDIRHFLLNFSHSIQVGKIPNGCLMVNTASEISDEDSAIYFVVKSYFSAIKKAFLKVLKREAKNGVLGSKTDIESTAQFLLGVAQSISIMSKVQSRKEIESYIDFAMSRV